jgi:formate hydrogenlyase subunit 6/NADH:ubiquinone oxidoreductase subunit I
MTSGEDLKNRRQLEAERIRQALERQRSQRHDELKGGETAVAYVEERLCIGCDQCDIVCDDDAIEFYKTPMKSPLLQVESNKKARIIRENCTGCRLCVLACPTDAIKMIDR